jgi:hypothetical protein
MTHRRPLVRFAAWAMSADSAAADVLGLFAGRVPARPGSAASARLKPNAAVAGPLFVAAGVADGYPPTSRFRPASRRSRADGLARCVPLCVRFARDQRHRLTARRLGRTPEGPRPAFAGYSKGIRLSDHLNGDGGLAFRHACRMGQSGAIGPIGRGVRRD